MPDTLQCRNSDPQDWLAIRQQSAFRQLLDAFAYPGRVCELDSAADALPLLLATLVDGSVTLADPHALIVADDWRRLGVLRATPEVAQFIVMPGDRPPDFQPGLGSLENPEQGATLILRTAELNRGHTLYLTGPGIEDQTVLRVSGVDPAWWTLRAQCNVAFPLGVDMLLISGQQIAAIPRTTHIAIQGVD